MILKASLKQLYKESEALSSSWGSSGRAQGSGRAGPGLCKFQHGRQACSGENQAHSKTLPVSGLWRFTPQILLYFCCYPHCQVYIFQKPSMIFSIKLYRTLLIFSDFQTGLFEIYRKWCCVILLAANCGTNAASLWFQFW